MGSLVRATRGLGARLWLAGLLVGGVSDAPAARQACTPQPITRLGGISPFQASGAPSLSADGRYTAFESSATDLDPNFGADIFVHDRLTCTLELVSVSSDEVPGNSSSRSPSISADGRFVAFESTATNLVAADASNFLEDIYVRDRQLGLTMLASVDSAGVQPVSGRSTRPRISGDGQIVAYISTSTTLVPGDTNAETDVFVRDLMNGTTARASVATGGAEGESSGNSGAADHALSVDARFIAFVSRMSNLVPGDSGTSQDVFVRDRLLDTTVLASLTSSGGQLPTANPGSPSLTADGRLVFFSSTDTFVTGDNTCDGIFVRDLVLNSTSCPILDPNNVNLNQSGNGVLVSADGRYVAFTSSAGHYTPGDTNGLSDVFVYDRTNGALRRASTTVYGAEAGGVAVSLSADGQVIAFASNASNLVPGDVNSASDVFVTVWGSLSVTPEFDLMRNGSFTTGLQFWQTFATPDPSYIVTDTTGGLLRFYRVPPPPGSANQAVAFQSTYAQLFPHAPLEARFRLGNSSSVRKRLSVLVHDGDFSDLSVCVFWLAPTAPLRDYVMRAHTTKSWSNATISFYAATAGSDGGFYQVDNVSLVYHPALDDDVVRLHRPDGARRARRSSWTHATGQRRLLRRPRALDDVRPDQLADRE